MANNVYGIDLGTTYSCIAKINENGLPEVIPNKDGTNTTPSVVFFDGDKVIVGQLAKDNTIIEPEHIVSLVKTLMGRSNVAINYNGEDKSPIEVSSYILKKVVQDASELTHEEVKDVVITVPAYFGAAERDATQKAGELAGLNVLDILSEPVASAYYYGVTNQEEEKNILIYDLGGGTFDVTVLNINPITKKNAVICADGDHDLGGKDWDARIREYLEDQFRQETKLEGAFDPCDLQEIALKAEKAKIELSQRESTTVAFTCAGLRGRVELTRDTFDGLTKDLLDSTITITDNALRIAEEKGVKIDLILLVGGSTFMPQVQKILKERYNMDPLILEPNEAVAKGAAKYASTLKRGGGLPDPGDDSITTIFATTKTYGVKVLGDGNEFQIDNLILKNEQLTEVNPTTNKSYISVEKDDYHPMENGQSAALIEIYESDSEDERMEVDEDFKLGEAILELPKGIKTSDQIILKLILNSNGMLNIHGEATVGDIRKEVNAELAIKGLITEEEFNRLKRKVGGISVM